MNYILEKFIPINELKIFILIENGIKFNVKDYFFTSLKVISKLLLTSDIKILVLINNAFHIEENNPDAQSAFKKVVNNF